MDYNNYFKNHIGYKCGIINDFSNTHKYLLSNFGILNFNLRNKRILDIGCGLGGFTSFCYNKGVIEYYGIDLDPYSIELLKIKYPNYNFINQDILKTKFKENYFDIIIMSHVFEHLNLEQANQLSKYNYFILNKGGFWLNIMPNASFIFSNHFRYGDITHKTLYTNNSFSQILLQSGFLLENITHKNDILGQTFMKRIFFNYIWKFFYKLLLLIIFPEIKIYTPTLISIINK